MSPLGTGKRGRRRDQARDDLIVARYREGATTTDIGRDWNISRERVRQILDRNDVVCDPGTRRLRRVEWTCAACGKREMRQPSKARARSCGNTDCRLPNISDAELIAELRRIAQLVERTPSIAHMNASGKYAHTTYCHRFGTWRAACEAAGLTPNAPGPAGWQTRAREAK